MKTFSTKEILAFLETFGTRSRHNDNVELMMDDHFHIDFMKKGYYIPENSILYSPQNEEMVEYLKDRFHS